MLGGSEPLRNHAGLAQLAMSREQLLPYFLRQCHGLTSASKRVAAVALG
jgi:hypothetical protein